MRISQTLVFSTLFAVIGNVTMAQDKRVAIVSMYAKNYIEYTYYQGDKYSFEPLLDYVGDSRFEFDEVLKNFHDRFMNEVLPHYTFQIIPESDVLNNQNYLNHQSV